MAIDKKTLAPPGFRPKAPTSGGYVARHPDRYAWRTRVAEMIRKTYDKFGWDSIHINTYHDHPPGLGRDYTSFDVWDRKGRGHALDPVLGQKVFDFLFNYEGLPNIEWCIYKGSMWSVRNGWTISPPGPADSDPRHDRHIHITYVIQGAGDLPKEDSPTLGGGKDNPIYGVDISGHQEGINVQQIKNEGFKFAVIKASEGPSFDGWDYVSPEYNRQMSAAKAAGMHVGAYHFLLRGPAKPQVDLFLKTIGDPKGKILMVDFEDYPSWSSYKPNNDDLKNFIAELKRRVGDRPILVYSGAGWWNGGDSSGPLSNYGSNLVAWDAYYPEDASGHWDYASVMYERNKHLGWGKRWGGVEPMFWQFSAQGRVAGYDIDVNAFRGTEDDLKKYAGTDVVQPPPPPPAKTQLQRITDLEKGYADLVARVENLEKGV